MSALPAAEAQLPCCVLQWRMTDLTSTIDFSSCASFALSEERLARVDADLQLAQACGGLLLMEAAFAAHSFVQSARASTDYEGGYLFELDIASPSGRCARARDVLMALYEAREQPDPANPDAELQAPPSWSDAELADAFCALDTEPIEQAEQALRAAFDHIYYNARELFYRNVMEAPFTPADAVALARMAKLDAAAAILERARLGAHAAAAPSSPGGSRI